jgi:hypothetical protein
VAQEASRPNLGLAAVGALGLHAGADAIERHAEGHEVGALMDLGSLTGAAVRLQFEVAFLRATLTETVVQDDSTYSDVFYDLTASVSTVLQGGGPRARLAPYLVAGVGVHALSSAFGTVVLDQRYNANPFGVHLGAGARLWLTGGGRHSVAVEIRRTIAENVNRTSFRLGLLLHYNDLIRRR